MAYPQDAGLSSLMANYGNISQGMNPGQQPSVGGNPYFPGMPGMNQSQVPSYQPQDWGGFAPGQLSSQYGQSTYGTNNGMVNYGYGQQPVIDYAKQLADQQAAAKAAADKAATTPSAVAQNVYTAPSLTGGQAPGRYDANLNGPNSPAMSPVETAMWAQDHPFLSSFGQYMTSPASTPGMLLNMFAPQTTQAWNSAFQGVNPEAVTRYNDTMARMPETISRVEQAARDNPGPVGPSASEQSQNRSDTFGNSGLAHGGITSLLR